MGIISSHAEASENNMPAFMSRDGANKVITTSSSNLFTGQKLLLQNYQGKYLQINPSTGDVSQTVNGTGYWEEFTLNPVANDPHGAFYLTAAANDWQIGCLPDANTIRIVHNRAEWERWTLVPAEGEAGRFYLRSTFNTYLTQLPDNKLYQSTTKDVMQVWTLKMNSTLGVDGPTMTTRKTSNNGGINNNNNNNNELSSKDVAIIIGVGALFLAFIVYVATTSKPKANYSQYYVPPAPQYVYANTPAPPPPSAFNGFPGNIVR